MADNGQGGSGQSTGTGGVETGSGGSSGGACETASTSTKALPPVVEFLVDVTTSMTQTSSSTGGQSKWAVVQSVLPTAFGSMPVNWAVGLSFFASTRYPWNGTQAVPIAPLGQNLTDINNAVARQTANGYTPTGKEWQFGLQQVTGYTDPAYDGSPRYIVLITDGVPTVSNDGSYQWSTQNNGQLAISQAEYDAFVDIVRTQGEAAGVVTFVVGVPGSEDPQGATYDPLYMLSELAIAGHGEQPSGCVPTSGTPVSDPNNQFGGQGTVNPRGTYCHFDMTTQPDFATGLTQALQAIQKNVISCSFSVPPPPAGLMIDPNKTRVTYTPGGGTPRDLTQASSQACDDGQWYVVSTDSVGIPTELQLCSATCDTVSNDTGAQVSVAFGCIYQE